MTSKMKMILAGACLALAGCGGGGGGIAGIAGPAEVVPVISADVDVNTVRVTDDLATITVNSVDVEAGTFSITFGLPDDSSVTITNADDVDSFPVSIGPGEGITVFFENEDGEVVVLIGLGLDGIGGVENLAEAVDEALFVLVRIDPNPDEEEPDLGFDTYMVTGDETDSLPTGSANYSGNTVATLFLSGGENVIADLFGTATIDAFFATSTVDVLLTGTDGHRSYTLNAENIGITGSRYSGALSGTINICDGCDVELDGDVLGAFYGDLAEATAGVFGAEGVTIEVEETIVEIVGGFAAFKIAPNGGNNANIK